MDNLSNQDYVDIQEYIYKKTGLLGMELVSMTELATTRKEQSLWWSVLNGYAEEGFGERGSFGTNEIAKNAAKLMLKRIEQGWVNGKLWPEIKGEVGYQGIKAEWVMLDFANSATRVGVNVTLNAVLKILLGKTWPKKYEKMVKSWG